MTDTHLSLLRLVALRRRRALEKHETDEPIGDAMSIRRRDQLARVAARASRHLKDAELRRQRRNTGRP